MSKQQKASSALGWLKILQQTGKIAMNTYKYYAQTAPKAKRDAFVKKTKSQYTYKDGKCTKNKFKCLEEKVNNLNKFMSQQTAVHIRKNRVSTTLQSLTGKAQYALYDNGGTIGRHESAMSSLRYFDAATNTLVTANAATGTYSRDMNVSIYRKLTLVNNYQTPCEVRVYKCIPKDATGLNALQYFESGLADQGNPDNRSPMIYPTDSKDLQNTYSMSVVTKRLMPGQMMVTTASTKNFLYEISTNDIHTQNFRRDQGGFNWFVRITGHLGHDTTVGTEHSIMPAGVDVMIETIYTFKYDAGKDLHDISVLDNSGTSFTTSGVYTSKPIADNIAFSIV